MREVLETGRSGFTYVGRWREYGVRCFEQDRPVWSRPPRYRRISRSPWCGRRLPGSLKAVWVSLLDLYGIYADMDHLPDANSIAGLPDAMLSDLWWRDRPDLYGDPRAGGSDLDPGHCRPPKDQLPDGDPRIAPPAKPGRTMKAAPKG
ncbi:MAG: hypothetical protein VYB54_03575 [Pseudomonadota bacterium]|nr:hypothetical protein [Pseudomonadota bacterium]